MHSLSILIQCLLICLAVKSSYSVPSASSVKPPTRKPSNSPTRKPSNSPTRQPSISITPSKVPTRIPSKSPSRIPSKSPSRIPSKSPSRIPSKSPSRIPSKSPSRIPSKSPAQSLSSASPSRNPYQQGQPSRGPTRVPSKTPSVSAGQVVTITNGVTHGPDGSALLDYVNGYRANIGISTKLVKSTTLMPAALWMADDLYVHDNPSQTGSMSTTDSLGRSLSTRLKSYGVSATVANSAAELSVRSDCFSQVLGYWRDVSAQDAILRDPKWKYIGIGVVSLASNSKLWYWVMDFATDAA